MVNNKEILKIFENCIFDEELTENNFYEKILYQLPHNFNYDYAYGATKLVILPEDKNYVIKIPFSGFFDSIYDEETDDYFEEFSPFKGANQRLDGYIQWDYCEEESQRFSLAKKEKLNYLFAETKYIGSVSKYPIYIQEKAEILSKNFSKKDEPLLTEKTYERIKNKKRKTKKEKNKIYIYETCEKNDFICFNMKWLLDLLSFYGKKTFYNFMLFLKENNFNEDLCSSNIGYINKKPVLVDYCGFNY